MAGIGVSGRELFTLPPFCSAINLSGPIAMAGEGYILSPALRAHKPSFSLFPPAFLGEGIKEGTGLWWGNKDEIGLMHRQYSMGNK